MGSRQPKVLLVLMDLSSQGSDLAILLLDDRVKPLALLSEQLHLVLTLCAVSLVSSFEISQLLPQLIILSTNILELVLQLAQLTC